MRGDNSMMYSEPKKLLASYGRRRGRRLRAAKQELMDTLLPELEIPAQGALDLRALFPQKKSYWLEIGFGGGEHLMHQAALHPEVGIIGCEPYINGVAGLLKYVRDHNIRNVRIHQHDARPLMARLPDACLDKVFILYPDPWPKARHHKRRLISTEFLTALARVMRAGAELRLATDHEDYCTWMLEHLLPHPGFTWTAQSCADWQTPWADWIPTRYEQKRLAGVPTYLGFRRK